MSKFIPFPNKIQIQPLKKDSMLVSDTNQFQEVGIVKAIGSKVKFVKKGDILLFNSWGCDKTTEVNGEVYYVVSEDSEFILGKINQNESKKQMQEWVVT